MTLILLNGKLESKQYNRKQLTRSDMQINYLSTNKITIYHNIWYIETKSNRPSTFNEMQTCICFFQLRRWSIKVSNIEISLHSKPTIQNAYMYIQYINYCPFQTCIHLFRKYLETNKTHFLLAIFIFQTLFRRKIYG